MGVGKKYYITSAIPYVNAAPHIGHALEFVQADAIARYHKLLGDDVVLLSGGDENALKNVQAAETAGQEIQSFVDKNNDLFREITKKLNCDYTLWQKGSDQKTHFPSSQKLWELCDKNGDIYQKEYSGLYCLGCEAFYTQDELNENGECFEHPGKKLLEVKEKNYFFRLSKYQEQLIKLLESDELKINPIERKNEILSFLKEPLQDISISRSNERAKNWGVPVPNDDTQRMYVWFDALNIYQSGIGFGWDDAKYNKYWPADIHVIGKGITRFHAVYWPAFLLSAKLTLPKELFIHGYFTVNGQKMSKTLGNVIDPNELIDKYGADALRYYFLAKFSPYTDGDFSEEKLKDVYNGELANGLGNLVSRVARLCELSKLELKKDGQPHEFHPGIQKDMPNFRFDVCLSWIWNIVNSANENISSFKLWENPSQEEKRWKLAEIVDDIRQIAFNLKPYLPDTAQKIEDQFKDLKVKPSAPLFPRIA